METVTRLYYVRRTLMKMLADRGYSVSDSDLGLTMEGFIDRFGYEPKRKELSVVRRKANNENDRILVTFSDEPKASKKFIDGCEKLMTTENARRVIIVVETAVTADARRKAQDSANMEVFLESELLVNITENEMVPKHEVLSPTEKAALLERYGIKDFQLPRMQASDPVARYYGLSLGQVVKIIRSSETAGKYVTYRIVRLANFEPHEVSYPTPTGKVDGALRKGATIVRQKGPNKLVVFRCKRSPRSVAVHAKLGFSVLADAIESLPLDKLGDGFIGNFAVKESVELVKAYSNLPESTKLGVLVASVLGWSYLTAKPGVLIGAVDAYLLAPLQIVVDRILGRRDLKRNNFIVGQKLGEGSFGTVYAGALVPADLQSEQELGKRTRRMEEYEGYKNFQKVTLKKVKLDVEGAEECGEMEEWFNYRMARAAPDVCADFMGSFVADATRGQFTQGGKWLVWKYEGDSTLADFMRARDFPENLAEPMFGELKEKDPLKRQALIIRKIMRQIITALKKMHATGIVHRDVKPSNLVVTNEGKLKFIDFGAATDLRVGKNYVPERGMLDPDYCPPELYVMPEETPRPPPAPIAAILSPFLWQLTSPDLFDMYSVGIILLQMASANLRSATAVTTLKQELEEVEHDLSAWRKSTRLRPNLNVLEEVGGGRGWDLATKLVCKRPKRLSASAALRHPYFLFGL